MITVQPTHVHLRYALFRGRGPLMLQRVPKYLRFTCKDVGGSDRQWDALDQIYDEPEDGEYLFAAKLADRGRMHVDRVVKGRRVGEWYSTADYELIDPQPAQEIMRNVHCWREWVMNLEAQAASDHVTGV